MSKEQNDTAIYFFGRNVNTVAQEFAAAIYDRQTKSVRTTGNPGRIVKITTPEGDRDFRVTVAEPYLEADATPIWKGKRAEEIRSLMPGEVITYRSRSGELSFIKTTEADNILIRGLEEVETGRRITTASEVTKTIGLTHREIGRLTYIEGDRFRFVKTI